jgi:4-amino-4-deoxy-L-arabinose transferase-like glycosyltransferase
MFYFRSILALKFSKHLFPLLLLFLSIRFILLALYIQSGSISLTPDEAQYWTWSQDLSWGYYSKPPGIAWQIYLTTSLFGNTEWGLRSSALIIGTLTCGVLYWLMQRVFKSDQLAFWTALTFSITPLSLMGSILAVTDGGMILSWLLALGFYLQGTWILFGLWIAIGALFKWPIFILPLILLFWALYDERDKVPFILKGLALSLIGLLPALIWNTMNNFVTFRHVGTTLQGGHYGISGNPIAFIGAQIGLLSPFFFAFAILAFILCKEGRSVRRVTSIFLLPLAMSFVMKMQGNWADFTLPTAHMLGMNWVIHHTRWSKLWIILACSFSLVIAFVLGSNGLPYPMNPLKNALGYRAIPEILLKNGYDVKKDTLISDSYQVTSLLSFYGPSQDRAYFFNSGNRRLNQFSFWPQLAEDQREEGYFATLFDTRKMQPDLPKNFQAKIAPYFSDVSYLGAFPLYTQKEEAQKVLLLYHVKGYNKGVPGLEFNPHF